MKSVFVMPGFHNPKTDFFMSGLRPGPRLGQLDFWGAAVDAIPTLIDKGTDIYIKREDEQIAEDRAEEAQARAAQAQATATVALTKNTVAGIDKSTFLIGAVGIGLVAVITTIALTR